MGYIGIVQHKEHSPEVLSIPPGTPCILSVQQISFKKESVISALGLSQPRTERVHRNFSPKVKATNARVRPLTSVKFRGYVYAWLDTHLPPTPSTTCSHNATACTETSFMSIFPTTTLQLTTLNSKSSVAVASFLPGRAKDLSALLYIYTPTSRCILFDGENISFYASLVIYIYIYIYIYI